MGTAMAIRLAACGQDVVTWTRSGRAVEELPVADAAAAAVADAEVVLLCLYDAASCGEVLELVREALPTGVEVVNTATVGPAEAAELAAAVRDAGANYVHAPVIGSTNAAAQGSLTLLVGAPDPTPPASAVLAALGEVLPCQSAVQAAAAKLVANGVLADALLTVRDARERARELGLDGELTWNVLEKTLVGGLVRGKRARLTSGNLTNADFTVGALAKDVGLLATDAPTAAAVSHDIHRRLTAGLLAADADVIGLCMPAHGLSVAPDVSAPSEFLEPLRAYAAGHATGDPSHHRRAFLPSAHIEGIRDGAFVSWTLDEFCSLFGGKPADDELDRRRRVDHVSVAGSTGSAVMTLWHGAHTFTDVFVLLHVDGHWRIANKAYHRGASSQ
jgi:3-hydroxyisobutyrate dehydrogenase-like beta-hydroxyacid dehydrogenase